GKTTGGGEAGGCAAACAGACAATRTIEPMTVNIDDSGRFSLVAYHLGTGAAFQPFERAKEDDMTTVTDGSYRERLSALLGDRDPLQALEANAARVEAVARALGEAGLSRSY